MTACPFCAEEVHSGVRVCRGCGRDIAIPSSLTAEHAELIRKRDQLRHELETAKARLTSRFRWLGSR
jgi:hypothetical protein